MDPIFRTVEGLQKTCAFPTNLSGDGNIQTATEMAIMHTSLERSTSQTPASAKTSTNMMYHVLCVWLKTDLLSTCFQVRKDLIQNFKKKFHISLKYLVRMNRVTVTIAQKWNTTIDIHGPLK